MGLSFRRNSIFGVLGFLVPTIVVLLSYPILVHTLGTAGFGVFLLATGMSGVLGFLDFGLSTATLQFVAEDMAREDRRGAGETLTTSLVFYGAVGGVAALSLWITAPWLTRVFSVDSALQPEAVTVFRLGGLQLAVFFVTTVFLSFFKGLHRFDLSTFIVTALSVLTYGGMVIGVWLFDATLRGVTAISLGANFTILAVSTLLAFRLCQDLKIPIWSSPPSRASMRRMLRFGIFVAIEKVAAMLSNQAQRLIIAAVLGPSAVTLYVTAYTVTIKGVAALRGAFEVVMPTTAALAQQDDEGRFERLRALYLRSTTVAAVLSIGGMALLFTISTPLVHWWLKSPIDGEVATLVRVLCIGMALTGITPVAYNVIAGLQRPQINTTLAIVDPFVMYAILGIFAINGLTIWEFAAAYSADLFIFGVFYLGFCELIVWRRWIPKILRQEHGVLIADEVA